MYRLQPYAIEHMEILERSTYSTKVRLVMADSGSD